MVAHQASPILLLVLLSAGVFLVRTVWLMLGPLLVELAAAFQTSVAVTGQLAGAIGLSWGITAPLVGPVSDTYGRRKVGLTGLLLMAIGTLGSVLAWSYGVLLACRLLTGVGAAMIPPNSIATIADHFPLAQRGTPISVLISASFFGVVIGTPLVALLAGIGGWRWPFYGVGALLIAVWVLQWRWFPRRTHPATPSFAFVAHFREATRSLGIWYVLAANVCYQVAALGIFTYLAANLRHTYGMTARETVVPLALSPRRHGRHGGEPDRRTGRGTRAPLDDRRDRTLRRRGGWRRGLHGACRFLGRHPVVVCRRTAADHLRARDVDAGGRVRRGLPGDRQRPVSHE